MNDFRALFESVPGLYLVLDPDLVIVAVSDAYLLATMTCRDTIVGRGLFEVFPDNPDDPRATGEHNLRASLGRVLANRVADAMAVQKYDIRRPEAEGGGFEERYWSPLNSPVLSATGDVTHIVHRVEDVTEFVRLQQHGREQQRVTDELQRRADAMAVEVYQRAQQLQAANSELRVLQAELETRVVARTAELERSNAALRRSEEQLRHSQKMEAIGRLAGGIAHDFNNVLTVIMGYGDALRRRYASDEDTAHDLDQVLSAAERAAALTRQLLAFSRQQVLEPRVLDLNGIVTNLDPMLRRLIGEDVDLVTAPAGRLGRVKADPGQIEQILVNLAVNARDAMPQGGKLTIETADVELDAHYVGSCGGVGAGRYVMVAVSDTGCGMSREVIARAFEPFYTTKPKGQGTGLGLSTAHGIVKQSGGHIEVYSEVGQGTTFKVYLPQVEDASEPEARPAPISPVGPCSGTIVLVEDEASIRVFVQGALRRFGYDVVVAADAEAALTLFDRTPHVDMLVTDVIMPGMSGPELVRQLDAAGRGVPVLYISGYTDRALVHQCVRESGTSFVQKPFTPESLVRKVHELLERGHRHAA